MSRDRSLCFLPDEYLSRKSQRRMNSLCAALFLIATLAIASAFATSDYSLRQIEAEHSTVVHEFNLAAGHALELARLQESQRAMASQAELTASLLEKIPRSYLVAEVTNAIPAGVTLVDLVIESKPRPVQTVADLASPPVDVSIRLIGRAQSDVQVSQFVNKLSKSVVLKDVAMTDKAAVPSVSDSLATGRQFTVAMSLDPGATLPEPTDAAPIRTTAIELGAQ